MQRFFPAGIWTRKILKLAGTRIKYILGIDQYFIGYILTLIPSIVRDFSKKTSVKKHSFYSSNPTKKSLLHTPFSMSFLIYIVNVFYRFFIMIVNVRAVKFQLPFVSFFCSSAAQHCSEVPKTTKLNKFWQSSTCERMLTYKIKNSTFRLKRHD